MTAQARAAYDKACPPPIERRVSIYDVDVCAFCSSLGVMHKCAWKLEKEVGIPITDLRVDDRVKLAPLRFVRVEFVSWSKDQRTIYYQLHGCAPFTARLGEKHSPSVHTPTLVGLRLAPCAAACCDLCAVERDANVHYCREHWHAWSQPS